MLRPVIVLMVLVGLLPAACAAPPETGRGSYAEAVRSLGAEMPSANTTPADWTEFVAPDGSFTVLLPGTPTLRVDVITSVLGRQEIKRFIAHTPSVWVDAGYMDRSHSVLAAFASDDQILDGSARGLAAAMNSRIDHLRRFSMGGHKGRALGVVLLPEQIGLIARSRLILTDRRVYHVNIVTRSAEPADDLAHECFESLRLQPPGPD